MNLSLKRNAFLPEGIFGEILSDKAEKLFESLEHAYGPEYDSATGYNFMPKLPAGTYVCQRGKHHLHALGELETFEITGVPGHFGVLFHPLNVEAESEGCVGIGKALYVDAITGSRSAFEHFMSLQAGLSHFTLTVEN